MYLASIRPRIPVLQAALDMIPLAWVLPMRIVSVSCTNFKFQATTSLFKTLTRIPIRYVEVIIADIEIFQSGSHQKQTVLTDMMQTFLSSASNFSGIYESPVMQEVTNTYSLSGTLCVPRIGTTNTAQVQYLLHGVGFDSRYAYS